MKRKAVVIGGSVAGVSCALALIKAGWDVVVIEKTGAPPTRSPTGAGLGLDPQAQEYIQSWIAQPDLLHNMILPLTIEQNQVVTYGHEKKTSSKLTRDEDFNFRTAYWADLYNLLYRALPDPKIVLWGYHFLSFCISSNKDSVTIKAEVLATDEIIEIVGDLLVAADGCHSSIRKHFLPDFKLSTNNNTTNTMKKLLKQLNAKHHKDNSSPSRSWLQETPPPSPSRSRSPCRAGSSSSSRSRSQSQSPSISRSASFRTSSSSVQDLITTNPVSKSHDVLLQALKLIDMDGEGKITRSDLQAIQSRIGADPPSEEERTTTMTMDVDRDDGDGFASLDTFSALGLNGNSELRDVFDIFDADGDGKISAEELLEIFTASGDDQCTLEDCRHMIDGVDVNGDGFVCFEDFCKMMGE